MFKALAQFFAACESLFRAVTNLAEAGENVTEWAKEETAFFNEKSTLERANKLVVLHKENAKRIEDLGIADDLKQAQAAPKARATKAKAA